MKYLKVRRDSRTYAYQRKIPKHLVTRANALRIPSLLTIPLKLDVTATQTQIASALDAANATYDRLTELLNRVDLQAVVKADIEPQARAMIEAAGYAPGALHGVTLDDEHDAYLSTLEDVLGERFHQLSDPQTFHSQDKGPGQDLPRELFDAVETILTQKPSQSRAFHLFSHAVDGYKAQRVERIKAATRGNEAQLKQKLREFAKEVQRLDDFLRFSGNHEFTTETCNDALKQYRKHLLQKYADKPQTAKRHLVIPAAAFRWYANEEATEVSVTANLKIEDQTRHAKIREVLDVARELPLVWLAAHDPTYDHFFRLAAFGIFSGAHARELCLTLVEDVREDYFIIGGTKRGHRRRPAVIVNDTHRALLLVHPRGSVVGEARASQSESAHSKLLKRELFRATGNPALSGYCLRHTGRHLANIKGINDQQLIKFMFGWKSSLTDISDDYGRAGMFSREFISRMKDVTQTLLGGLP